MAAPDYITNLQDITLSETITDWSALGGGGAGLSASPDLSFQGTNCVDKSVGGAGGAEKGQVYNFGTTISTGVNVYYYIWTFQSTPGLADSLQNRGVCMVLGTATNAYVQFHVEGNETYGAAGRLAKCYPIRYKDYASTVIPYRTLVGSPGANPQYFGATTNITSTVKGANLGVDAMRYGDGISITGGQPDNPASFTGCAYKNDLINNRWGVLTKVGGAYELQGKLRIGKSTADVDTATYFSDSNRFINIGEAVHTDVTFSQFIISHASSTFNLTNCSIIALNTGVPGRLRYESQSISSLLTNTSFTDFGNMSLASGVTGQSSTWRRCKTVVQSGAYLDSCNFENSISTSALVSDNPQRITNCNFTSAGTGHAIEIIAPGSYNFDGNSFTNYSPVTGNSGTEAIYNNSAGAVTLNVTNATPPTYRNGAGASTTVTATVLITLDGMKDGSEVRIYRYGTLNEIAGIEQVTDGSEDDRSFQFSDEAGNQVNIIVFNTGYAYYRINNYVIPSNAATLPIDQKIDRVYENP